MSSDEDDWEAYASDGTTVRTTPNNYEIILEFITHWSGTFADQTSTSLTKSALLPKPLVRSINSQVFENDSFVLEGSLYASPRAKELYKALIELCLGIRKFAGLSDAMDGTDPNELNLRIFRKYQLFRDSEGSGQIFCTMSPSRGQTEPSMFFRCGVFRSKKAPTMIFRARIKNISYGQGDNATIGYNISDEKYSNYDLDTHVLVTKIMTTRPKKTKGASKKARSSMYAAVDVVRSGTQTALLRYTAYLMVQTDLPGGSFFTILRRTEDGLLPPEIP